MSSSNQQGPYKLPELIELIGDEDENFYQLGLADRGRHKLVLDHILGLTKTPWTLTDKIVRELLKNIIDYKMPQNQQFNSKIKAYAEGLGEDPQLLRLCFTIPEFMSSLSSWLPAITPKLLGCSSYFAIEGESGRLMHARILDFPLQGSFDVNERIMKTQWGNGPKILSFGANGFPYPSITAMNSNHLSLALHQKFTSRFNPQGTSIFELANQVLQRAKNLEEVIEILEQNPSITTWALYIGEDIPGRYPRVLEVDTMAGELEYIIHELEPNKILYFHNQLLKGSKEQKNHLPYGIETYNKMRAFNAKRKCHRLEKKARERRQGLNAATFLKEITTLESLPKNHSEDDFRDWKMDSITLSAVTAVVMMPSAQKAYGNPGPAPKYCQREYFYLENIWDTDKLSIKTRKMRMPSNKNIELIELRQQGWRHVMEAQSAFDKNDKHQTFHHLQMGIDYFDRAKSYEKVYPQFFLLIFQYMSEKNDKNRYILLASLKSICPMLPIYLRDHCRLFILRLEKILGQPAGIQIHEITHPMLRKIYEKEKEIPDIIFHQVTSTLMSPRMDIADLIYPHAVIHPEDN